MKEIHDIIRAFELAQRQQKQTALATVVHVDGSSYRRPGARMLVTEDGQLTGAISGGCLEGDALRKALFAMAQQKAMLVTYDTSDEDDAKLGVGLGCNGIIQVLIEPINPADDKNPVQYLKAAIDKRQQSVLITLFSLQNKKGTQQGTCLLFTKDAIISKDDLLLKDILVADAKEVLSNEHSSFKNYISDTQHVSAFIEMIQPVVSLIIIGAGNDVRPLTEMAAIVGWETTVIDGRANYARAERFPKAKKVLVAKPENVLQQLNIDAQTVFVLMTHNYNYDLAMLRLLLQKNILYLGMLGPKKKLEYMLGELKEQGMMLTNQQLSAIYSPVGLDIGAETPEEIALSIMAEIKAILSGRQGKLLRHHPGSIHLHSPTRIDEVKLTSGK
jgi:xanthine dehydrogenase accessory factor